MTDWYDRALATPHTSHWTEVEGARIHHRSWGGDGLPVVLVHGGAAHSGWWDHVAPHLTPENHVVAIDLSGHGDSDHRESYSLEQWAREVLAVAAAVSDRKPLVIGHSMGGFVSLTAAREHGERLRGVAAIDSPVVEQSTETKARRAERGDHVGLRFHDDRDALVARFRTIPEDEHQIDTIVRHIAEQSVVGTDRGWRWKFDPHVFLTASMSPEEVAESACPVALVRGEQGLATSDITADVRTRLGGNVPVTVIPGGGHHLMLDQPIALIAVLETLIGQWRHS